MSKASAKAYYDKQIGDPDVGFITPQDAKDAIEVMYTDLDLVGTSRLIDAAVTTPKMADGAVTDAKLAGGIDPAKILGLGNMLTADQASLEAAAAHVGVNCTVARTTAQALRGAASLQITAQGSEWAIAMTDAFIAVQPGQLYTGNVALKSSTTPRDATCEIVFYRSDGSWLGGVSGTLLSNSTSGWTGHTATGVAPQFAAYARVAADIYQAANGEVHYADWYGLWRGAGGEWQMPGVPIPGLGTRPNPADTSQVQVWNAVTQTWITV